MLLDIDISDVNKQKQRKQNGVIFRRREGFSGKPGNSHEHFLSTSSFATRDDVHFVTFSDKK
ncbi:hypothetical protein HCH_02193 [Hahella chejuensis KCTC 2396]|uniref:Uncharacterized protein n=1 Tax=Hahella chejuensis (strain KCTC 2396) TaxID=349521 RepID=Q2SK04_HAHCH|nr:hypothetical protein HCH_02193 [Hahella chejuensis KCTC 2396]